MKPARYIFLNRGLGMSAGKCAAQAAHAETLAAHDYFMQHYDHDLTWTENQEALYAKWYGDGHYAKYVMTASDATQMFTIKHYLEERGFKCYMVVDEGHTEDTYFVPTALAVELVDKDDERITSIFGEFRMYRDKRPDPTQSEDDRSTFIDVLHETIDDPFSGSILVFIIAITILSGLYNIIEKVVS